MEWTPQEAVKTVMKQTPFHDFHLTPIPLKFDYETRFSHFHVVGGSGAGKTQLLQNLILNDLNSDLPPALIVVDSQSELINKISQLEVFHHEHGALRGKLAIITPREIDCPCPGTRDLLPSLGIPTLTEMTVTPSLSHLQTMIKHLDDLASPKTEARFLFKAKLEFGKYWIVPPTPDDLVTSALSRTKEPYDISKQ